MYNDIGDNSDGFKIILHPDARAGPNLNPALSNGKFMPNMQLQPQLALKLNDGCGFHQDQ